MFTLISSQPLNVMAEVGQCLFTAKAIISRQTTICRQLLDNNSVVCQQQDLREYDEHKRKELQTDELFVTC